MNPYQDLLKVGSNEQKRARFCKEAVEKFMASEDYKLAAAVMVAEILWFTYFYRMSMKQFGGVTGDLAGYYVTTSELVAVIVLAVMCVW